MGNLVSFVVQRVVRKIEEELASRESTLMLLENPLLKILLQ